MKIVDSFQYGPKNLSFSPLLKGFLQKCLIVSELKSKIVFNCESFSILRIELILSLMPLEVVEIV